MTYLPMPQQLVSTLTYLHLTHEDYAYSSEKLQTGFVIMFSFVSESILEFEKEL
jgi:hypothetical protein